MSSNRLAENAIKLNEKLSQLRETLRPAIKAAREEPRWSTLDEFARSMDSIAKTNKALIEAGKLLGVE